MLNDTLQLSVLMLSLAKPCNNYAIQTVHL